MGESHCLYTQARTKTLANIASSKFRVASSDKVRTAASKANHIITDQPLSSPVHRRISPRGTTRVLHCSRQQRSLAKSPLAGHIVWSGASIHDSQHSTPTIPESLAPSRTTERLLCDSDIEWRTSNHGRRQDHTEPAREQLGLTCSETRVSITERQPVEGN